MKEISDEIKKRFSNALSDSMINSENILLRMISGLKADTVLEIGTGFGCSTVFFATHFKKVITIDITTNPLRKKIWEHFKVEDRIFEIIIPLKPCIYKVNPVRKIMNIIKNSFSNYCSDTIKHQIIQALDFDLAVLDGDHTFEGVSKDFESVKKCGLVLFHDYKPKEKGYSGVVNFVNILTPTPKIINQFALWCE